VRGVAGAAEAVALREALPAGVVAVASVPAMQARSSPPPFLPPLPWRRAALPCL